MEIEVEEPDYQTASAPDELKCGGGPCAFVGAIYGEKGYLLHLSRYDPQDQNAVEFFADLARDVKDKSRLEIFLGGCGTDSDKDITESALENRKLVMSDLKLRGLEPNIRKVRWCPKEWCQGLRIIPSEGRAAYEEYNHKTDESRTFYS